MLCEKKVSHRFFENALQYDYVENALHYYIILPDDIFRMSRAER